MNFLYQKRNKKAGLEFAKVESEFNQLSISSYLENKHIATELNYCEAQSPKRRKRNSDEEYCNRLNLLEFQSKTRSCRKACLVGSNKERRVAKENYNCLYRSLCHSSEMNTFPEYTDAFKFTFYVNVSSAFTVQTNLSEEELQSVFPFFYYKCLLEYTMYRLFKSCFMSANPHFKINFEEDKFVYNVSDHFSSNFYHNPSEGRAIDCINDSWKMCLNKFSSLRATRQKFPAICASTCNTDSSNNFCYEDSSSDESNMMDID